MNGVYVKTERDKRNIVWDALCKWLVLVTLMVSHYENSRPALYPAHHSYIGV
ncbi:MAG: hypothetical protein JWM14_2976 [Chitinophagaceae bacterium]|nr:hypothetical protein [Chitinophagaceae bacterium]